MDACQVSAMGRAAQCIANPYYGQAGSRAHIAPTDGRKEKSACAWQAWREGQQDNGLNEATIGCKNGSAKAGLKSKRDFGSGSPDAVHQRMK
jgi:hypothetical protein